MVRRSEDGPTEGEAITDSDALKVGWQETVQDMRAMATDREEKGYETLAIPSHNTAPIAPGDGDDDRFGLSHLADSDDAERFVTFYEGRDFSDTGVYQKVDGGNVFMVTEHIDYDNEQIVFVAGVFRVIDASATVRAAMARGKMYTYVRGLDQTILGTFEHDDPSDFFPNPDVYYSAGPNI